MYLRIEESTIYYKWINKHFINSKAPSVIFLHHGLGSTEQWYDYPEIFSELYKYPVLLYDRTGHGKSTGLVYKEHNTKYLDKEAFEFLPEITEKLKISLPFILYGHSDGGTIALMYASMFPDHVLSVISESAHFINEPLIAKGIKSAMHEFENGILRNKLLKYHGDKTDILFYRWAKTWISEESKNWNIAKQLKSVKCPVLCIQGMQDEYGSQDQVKILTQNISGTCSLLNINDCQHYPHITNRESVLKGISEFFNCMADKGDS